MTTVNKEFAERIIKHNGYYAECSDEDKLSPDNPRCVRIVEYTNAWNRKAYGATFENETPERQKRYLVASEYIRDPKVIWAYTPPVQKNMEGREMIKAEDRKGVLIDLTAVGLVIEVAQDGVTLNFYPNDDRFPKGLAVNVDAIGPQTKDSLIRKGLDAWVVDMQALAKLMAEMPADSDATH